VKPGSAGCSNVSSRQKMRRVDASCAKTVARLRVDHDHDVGPGSDQDVDLVLEVAPAVAGRADLDRRVRREQRNVEVVVRRITDPVYAKYDKSGTKGRISSPGGATRNRHSLPTTPRSPAQSSNFRPSQS
jgi:hypothetical protein